MLANTNTKGSSSPDRSRYLALAISLLMLTVTVNADVLISATLILEHDTLWLHSNGFPEATNGVRVLKLIYWTPALDGTPSMASAAYVDPETACATPLVCFIHGTTYLKDEVPSNWQDGPGASKEGYTFASTGMACVLPDLLGLGVSPGPHPYLHAASEATACMDAVRAAMEYRVLQGSPLHDQLFLMGASAGSHACLATAQAMQTQFPDEFHIAAAGGISGPYAPYPVIKNQLLSTQPYGAGSSIAYVLFSYDAAYPGLFNSPADFLVEPYATELPPLFDGTHDGDVINPLLPPVIGEILPQPLRDSIATDSNSPLNQVLKENNVFNWEPQFPVKLCYCGSDEVVSPINTSIAKDAFIANGADQISSVEVSTTENHTGCGELARPVLMSWFHTMKVNCDGTLPDIVTALELGNTGFIISPNPANAGIVTLNLGQLPESGVGAVLRITALGGALVYAGTVVPNGQGQFVLATRSWPSGFYVIEIQNQQYSIRQKLAVLN
jgi:pimeloyl-ACP methyl ester carboxylesterase